MRKAKYFSQFFDLTIVMLKTNHIFFIILFVIFNFGCSKHTTTLENKKNETMPVSKVESSEVDNGNAEAEPDVISESTEESDSEDEAKDEVAEDTEDDENDKSADDMDEFEDEFGEPAASDVWDPLEGYNRFMTSVNDKLIVWILEPVAKGYRFIVPEAARRGISRFFTNLLYPVRVVNNLLQLKLKNAGEETLRFIANTTIGILGFWDPASEWFGLEAHHEDFGQTLGHWGVGGGFHIVLPFFGPSNLRDMFSMYPDYYLKPGSYIEPQEAEWAVFIFDNVNDASLNIGVWDSLKKDALDFYPFLRDFYEQKRIKEIKE